MTSRDIVIAGPVRTPIGAYSGALKGTPATELGAIAVAAALKRSGLAADKIGSVVLGNVIQAGSRMNPARQAAVGGGLPVEVPAMTVNRVCGSGAQAIVTAAQEIALGLHDAAIAGGMENMDRAPYLMDGGRWGYRMGPAQILDSLLTDGLNDAFSGEHSGWHTEDLATRAQLTREAQDEWAARSQQRFSAAREKGVFEAEIAPVALKGRKGDEIRSRFPSCRWPPSPCRSRCGGWIEGDVGRHAVKASARIALGTSLREKPIPEVSKRGPVCCRFRAGDVILVRTLHLVRKRADQTTHVQVVANQAIRRQSHPLTRGSRLQG
jgi:Thiolase, N-terminal domain